MHPRAGDLDDLSSRLARLAATHRAAPIVTVDLNGSCSRHGSQAVLDEGAEGGGSSGEEDEEEEGGGEGEGRDQAGQADVGPTPPKRGTGSGSGAVRGKRRSHHEDWELL